jgi:hypothetical protein
MMLGTFGEIGIIIGLGILIAALVLAPFSSK